MKIMKAPFFVLSPCGTSLLTNHTIDKAERDLIGYYANTKKPEQIDLEDLTKLQLITDRARHDLNISNLEIAAKKSAELNGIIKLYEGQVEHKQDYHLLLCTDTWLGETTATLVAEWLRAKGVMVEIKRQIDLQTQDIEAFQTALSEIVGWCEEIIPGYRSRGYKIIFNLTGGFKSVQGFLQTLATFYADESIYIFETAQDLLRIPRLPVQMVAGETVRQNLTIFRRLSVNLPVSKTTTIPETLLMKVDGLIGLSPWGELVWEQTKDTIYREGLYPSPSEKLKFGKSFEESVRKLAPDRFIHINDRIDQLAKNLETNGQYNPQSLDFKPLKGNPRPPSTHEMDAWADQDAKRIFGHFDHDRSDIFVLDKLDRALH